MKKTAWMAAAVLAAWAGGAWAANEADELVQQAIRGANTNTEKAQKLFEAAEIAKDDPKLGGVLLEKAAEYAVKEINVPAAKEIADKALDQLSGMAPPNAESAARRAGLYREVYNNERSYEGKERAARKLVPALMEAARLAEAARKYSPACEAYAEVETVAGKYKLPEKSAAAYRVRRARAMVSMDAKEKQFQATLKTNSADTKARMGLLKLLVFEKDAPGEAVRWLADDVDQAWQANVKLAAGDPSALAEAGARELGDWYYSHMQASDAAVHVKGTAAARAQTYYTRFLSLHKNQDQPALKAKLALKEIEAFLASTGGAPATEDDGSIDLLAGVDTAKNATSGQWAKSESGLAVNAKDEVNGLLEIPAPATGDAPKGYQLTVTFARYVGNSTIAVVFPFGSGSAALLFDRYTVYTGLEHLDTNYYYYSSYRGITAPDYDTPRRSSFKPLVNKKTYTVTIVVTPMPNGNTRIVASANDQEVASWEGRDSDINRKSRDWALRSGNTVGLGTYRGQAIFNRARLKILK